MLFLRSRRLEAGVGEEGDCVVGGVGKDHRDPMELVHVVGREHAVALAEGAEHFGGLLEVYHVDALVAILSELAVRHVHNEGVPLAVVGVAEHCGLKILVEGVVRRCAAPVGEIAKRLLTITVCSDIMFEKVLEFIGAEMRNLIITLLATSSVDSLNPIGITQQFVLQGMLKKPRHIWYFILTTAAVNMIFGYLVYYGVIGTINLLFSFLLRKYTLLFLSLEIFFGLCLVLFSVGWLLKKIKLNRQNRLSKGDTQASEKNEIKAKIKYVTPLALINIGIISTVSELTSAVPYFAFLSVLITYHFSFGLLTLVLICYNIIYIAPFVLLYVIYILSKAKFDRVYAFFRKRCSTLLGYSIPFLLFIIAAIIVFNGVSNIMTLV